MLARLMVGLLLVGVLPVSAWAQHWTAEEQEIIDLNQACWDAWASQSVSRMEATCNEHEDGRSWWTSNAGPDRGWFARHARRRFTAIDSKEQALYWEINPLSVRVFDGTALIHFWATRTFRAVDGNVKTESRKQLNIWQRIEGRWTWIGGMATPDSK
jgi:hypothetical protein